MRRFGERIVTGQIYRNRPGIYAVIHDGTGLLLTHQSEPLPEYQLPGGGIDRGENLMSALHREVLEETGWRIAVGWRIGTYQRYCYMPEYDFWARKVCHVYSARAIARECDPKEPHHQAVWTSFDQALRLLAGDGDRHMLARALRRPRDRLNTA